MIFCIEPKRIESLKWGVAALLIGLYVLGPGCWAGAAWAQQTPRELRAPIQRNSIQAPVAHPNPPSAAPIALPVTDPNSALGSALAVCDQEAKDSQPFVLPNFKGEVRLDHCYRGRDHFVCGFNALLTEAKSLLEDYTKIIEANYPEMRDVGGICIIKLDALANDLQNATEFTSRV